MYNLKPGPDPGKRFHDKGLGDGYLLETPGFGPMMGGCRLARDDLGVEK